MTHRIPQRRRALGDCVAKSRDLGNVVFTADFAKPAANQALFAKLAYDADKDFEAFAWPRLVVPTGNLDSAAAKFSQALQAALGSPAVKSRFDGLGVEPMPGSADEMARFARTERERWGHLIRANGICLD